MALHYYPYINKILAQLKISDSILASLLPPAESSFLKPFITIAREPGSGGRPIARAVAEKLGFMYVDDQILEEIARSTKRRMAVIRQIDEKSRSAIEDMVQSLLNKEYIDDIKFVSEMVRVILTYAHKGNCVIFGRGSNFITPFAKGLHVLITAPYKIRVQRAVDFEGHSQKVAEKVIAQEEKKMNDFVKQYLRQDHTKKNAYDLVLNTTYFQVDEARRDL